MITAEGLTKRFRTRRGPVVAVDDVSFHLDAGEFVGYVGPNGAGKSTTIKMMCGVLTPTAGSLHVDGLVPSRDRRALTRRMGVVFGQRTQLWWDLPLRHSLGLVGRLYRIESQVVQYRLEELIEVLDLGPLMNVPVRSLSLGQRMRGELAAAVLPAPALLFLDEPTIGLDLEAKAAVRGFLARLNSEHRTTVILTTHDLGDITELCRRLLIIDHGRVIYDGSIEGLKDAFAAGRGLVIDLADDRSINAAGAEVVRREGRRHWLHIPRDQKLAAVVSELFASYDIEDLAVEEPDVEDIIRRIYRGADPQGQT